MQSKFNKDYRFLLQRLIPRYLLSSQRIEGIQAALSGTDRLEMIRQAYLSLEELTSKGVYRKQGVRRSGETVSVSYVRAAGRTRITLELSNPEWGAVSSPGEAAAGIVPSVLAGIISSLSLNDSPKRVDGRIIDMLALAPLIQSGATGKILLLQDVPFVAERMGDDIKVSAFDRLSANDFYRRALGGGEPYRFVPIGPAMAGRSLFSIEPGTRSALLVPLSNIGLRWGILEIHLPHGVSPDADVLGNFTLLAAGLTRLLENNRHLENMVSFDRLTQVYNRNYYESQLPLEMERATRNRKYLTFLILDIDDFKAINDRYGHDAGDSVLKLVAECAKNHLRKIDLFFRFGGEEFIALLPGAGREDAERTAERIREVISRLRHTLESGEEIAITISIGGCIYPVDAQNETELFRRADKALYISKREGKNKVTFYRAGM
jgi:diguanylate cyclase (GGDEF)-like protein